MQRSWFSEGQIMGIPREPEAGQESREGALKDATRR